MISKIATNGENDKKIETPVNGAHSNELEYPPFVDQVHGLPLALVSKSRKVKVFWWLVFLACTSCGMLTTALVIIEYVQVPTATSIKIKLVPSLELPAITICPESPTALNYEPLFENIRYRLPGISNETAFDLVYFWLAGSGLHTIFPVSNFNESRLAELDQMYKLWSEGYDTRSFFHRMQEMFGYRCEQLFKFCSFGSKTIDCCRDMFRLVWVIRLGACYQTRRNLNQTGAEGVGLFKVEFKPPPSVKDYTITTQTMLSVYVKDNFEYVFHRPGFYLFPDDYNTIHLSARLVELQEHPHDCTKKVIGKDALCFLNKWIRSHLLDPFNCTIPYLNIPGISEDTKVCDPLTIVKNYYTAVQQDILYEEQCIPGCTKWEYNSVLDRRITRSKVGDNYKFHLVVGYDDLQYEHVKEISTISISGLISQVGGQLGLYLGLSIITLLQIVVYCVNKAINLLFHCLRPVSVVPEVYHNENRKRHCNCDANSYV